MKKSEHTELAILSRLAVLASDRGLQNLSYGNAAQAAHVSKGALQRLFPDKSLMHSEVLHQAVRLMTSYVFQYVRIEMSDDVNSERNISQEWQATLTRLAAWISGDAGFPGGCVLLACACTRGLSDALQQQVESALNAALRQLSAKAHSANRISEAEREAFQTRLLAQALWLHAQQFLPSVRADDSRGEAGKADSLSLADTPSRDSTRRKNIAMFVAQLA
jgi:AcrR family transcriptional regulator